jgi:two-component system sensor histidine kinase BarA
LASSGWNQEGMLMRSFFKRDPALVRRLAFQRTCSNLLGQPFCRMLCSPHGAALRQADQITRILTRQNLSEEQFHPERLEPEHVNSLRPVTRVLVAEDNPINQKLAKRLLEKLGCQVDLASNGVEAVQMWAQFGYNAIFMDCVMPEMDGYEATREIRMRE